MPALQGNFKAKQRAGPEHTRTLRLQLIIHQPLVIYNFKFTVTLVRPGTCYARGDLLLCRVM